MDTLTLIVLCFVVALCFGVFLLIGWFQDCGQRTPWYFILQRKSCAALGKTRLFVRKADENEEVVVYCGKGNSIMGA